MQSYYKIYSALGKTLRLSLLNNHRYIFHYSTTTILPSKEHPITNLAPLGVAGSPTTASKANNQLSIGTSKHSGVSNKGARVNQTIFEQQFLPSYLLSLRDLSQIQQITTYNESLANGPATFDEYPLKKLIHIGLKMITENCRQTQKWREYQFHLRKRLHQRSVQENLQVVYILLEVYPIYRVDYQFMMGLLVAVSKELPLMTEELLQGVYYICSTFRKLTLHAIKDNPLQPNGNQFNNKILTRIQSEIVSLVLKRHLDVQKNQKVKVLVKLSSLFEWICLGLSLANRNNPIALMFDNKVVQLINYANQYYSQERDYIVNYSRIKADTLVRIVKIIDQLQMASLYHHIRLERKMISGKEPKKEDYLKQASPLEFIRKLRINIIAFHSRAINDIIINGSFSHRLLLMNVLLAEGDLAFVDQYLQQQASTELLESTSEKYPNIVRQAARLLSQTAQKEQQSVYQLRILYSLFDRRVYDPKTAIDSFNMLTLKTSQTLTLSLINQIVQMQLLLGQSNNTSLKSQQELVMEYFSSSLRMHRHFDWYIYNYLFERKLKHAETARMITDQAESNQLNVNWRVEKIDALLIKVLQETKFAVTDAVVEEEKKLLKEKQTTFELFKFFREIKVHNVEEVPVILSPFKRVVQFANIEQRYVVNAYSDAEMSRRNVGMQKRLLNLHGWRVINLNSSQFIRMHINQRLAFLQKKLDGEQAEVKKRLT